MVPIRPPIEIASALRSELGRFPHLTFAVLSDRPRPAGCGRTPTSTWRSTARRRPAEIEQEREIDRETEIQIALERVTQRNVEILVLNRAPATVCAAALTSGRVVLMRDPAFYSRYSSRSPR